MAFESRLLSGVGVLSAVVEAGSFARAGEALGLTQSAVSRAVSRLEQRLGVRLFHRSARAVALTEEGRHFLAAVAPHLAAIEEAAAEAKGAQVEVRGRLRVQVDGTFGHYLLAPAIHAFLARHPALFVEIAARDRMGDLVGEGFDVAVRFGEPEPSSLVTRRLLSTRVVTCASPAYVARRGVPSHPRELAHHAALLIRDPATGRPFDWALQRKRETFELTPSGQLLVDDTGGLLGACLGGAGVAQLLELYARPLIEAGKLVQLFPEWSDETFPLHVYHHSPRHVSARVRAFLDFVAEITGVSAPRERGARTQKRSASVDGSARRKRRT